MVLTILQPQPERSNVTLAPNGAKSASTAPSILLSRSTNNCVFIYTSSSNQVSEQIFHRWSPAVIRLDADPLEGLLIRLFDGIQ